MKRVPICLAVSLLLFGVCWGQVYISGALSGVLEDTTYIVEGDIYVEAGDSLVIEAGAEFLFEEGNNFDVRGFLYAVGSETDSIKFEPLIAGLQWHGIDFQSTADDSSRLSYCLITGAYSSGIQPDGGGGGIAFYGCSANLEHCLISGNLAERGGGGIGCTLDSHPTITNCIISDNSSNIGGGGIACVNYSNALIIDCTISGNSAVSRGGGIFCGGSEPVLDSCRIINNTASNSYGGGIYGIYSCPTISNCTIEDNSANYCGGASFMYGSAAVVYNCVLTGNNSTTKGGGIYCRESNVTIEDTEISDNTTPNSGGGLYSYLGSLVISSCLIESNTSTFERGGGIYSYSGSLNLDSCTIKDNSANYFGGGIFNYGVGVITNCLIEGNIAQSLGGGIFDQGYNLTVQYCTIMGNNANSGGGISCGDTYISNCVISGNYAEDQGSALLCGLGDVVNVVNSIIEGNSNVAAVQLCYPTTSISYCDFYNNASGNFSGNPSQFFEEMVAVNINGDSCDTFCNIYLDPMFVNPVIGDFNLQEYSPCIDAGDPYTSLDPESTIADMGVYYFNQSIGRVRADGSCFLEYQTNHQGSRILFSAVSPGAVTDSIFTINAGYFLKYLYPGDYNIDYFHYGYESFEILGQSIYSAITLPDVTLSSLFQQLSGGLSGILEAGDYFVVGDIFVSAADTLIIEPGVVLYFEGACGFTIEGMLSAIGSEDDSVKFIPAASVLYWKGINFESSASDSSVLEYCVIRRGDDSGIELTGCSASITHCLITENTGYDGGGIACWDYSHPAITNCAITGNTALNGPSSIDGNGGGIFLKNNCSPQISDCVISQNSAHLRGGGIYCINSSNPIMENCLIDSNIINCMGGLGGGISCFESSLVIVNCSIIGNSTGNYSTGRGGGISFFLSTNPSIDSCIINGNSSTYEGRGIHCWNTSSVTITNSTICGNMTGDYPNAVIGYGGGIRCEGSGIYIENCIISDNWAKYSAGGIGCKENSVLNIINSHISGNSSEHNGGVCVSEAFAFIQECTIVNNSAEETNGGISLWTDNSIIENTVISGNTAGEDAGGVGIYTDDVTIINCTIVGNSAIENGGGISFIYLNSFAEIINSIVADNSGGGIYFLDEDNADITYCDFHNNQGGDFTGEVPINLGQIVAVNLNGDSCDIYSNIFLDPLFYSTTGDSAFYLTANSPCIDAGDPTSPPDPDSTIADMGAFWPSMPLVWVEPTLSSPQPTAYSLSPAYPNPFNAQTKISFELRAASLVELVVYDVMGREVVTLVDGFRLPGVYEATFDGSDLASGVYFVQLQVDGYRQVRKMILVK